MKKLLFLFTALLFISCSSGEQEEQGDMQLTIVNNNPPMTIKVVELQGYSFDTFEIKGDGGSRTFTLYDGIPSGSSDIGVRLIYDCNLTRNINKVVNADFENGKNTTITFTEDRTGLEDWQVTCNHTTSVVIN